MKTLSLLLFLIFNSIVFSQEIPKSGKSIKDFVPNNWKIYDQAEGDLNKDKKSDIVLIIEDTNPKNILKNEYLGSPMLNLNPRYLLILFKTSNGYDLVEINKTFLPSENDQESPCLFDPLSDGGIDIKNGVFTLSLNYWMSCGSWYTSTNHYKFRYQKNNFELIGFDAQEFHRASGEMSSVSINFSTKKMSITTGGNMFGEDADGNEIETEEKTEWKTFKIDTLQNLNSLKTPMEWEFMGYFI